MSQVQTLKAVINGLDATTSDFATVRAEKKETLAKLEELEIEVRCPNVVVHPPRVCKTEEKGYGVFPCSHRTHVSLPTLPTL